MRQFNNITIIKRITHILPFLFLLVFAKTQDSISYVPTKLHLAKNTTLGIGRGTQIKLNANLKLQSDINGLGVLKIQSKQNTFIDAKGHTIPILLIQTQKKVHLISKLKIEEEIKITKGKLILNNSDLVLRGTTKINSQTFTNIEENMEGKIRTRQYIFLTLYSSPSVIDNSPNPLIKNGIKNKQIDQIIKREQPYQGLYYQEPPLIVEPPPPKKNSVNKFSNNKKCIV